MGSRHATSYYRFSMRSESVSRDEVPWLLFMLMAAVRLKSNTKSFVQHHVCNELMYSYLKERNILRRVYINSLAM